jgi:hypothetical protein
MEFSDASCTLFKETSLAGLRRYFLGRNSVRYPGRFFEPLLHGVPGSTLSAADIINFASPVDEAYGPGQLTVLAVTQIVSCPSCF